MRAGIEQRVSKSIIETTKSLPSPENDFSGVQVGDCAVPNNILMFQRNEELSKDIVALHHRYVLHCVLETAGTVIVDGSHIRLEPEEALLVFPHQLHTYGSFDARRILWLFVTFELSADVGLEACRYRRTRLSDNAIWIVERLLSVYRGGSKATDAEEMRLLTGILLRELRAAAGSDKNDDSNAPAHRLTMPLMKQVASYIHANLHRLFTIAEIADQVFYSESQLRSVFQSVMGMSLGAYIRWARISRAESLLATSGLSVTQIAEQCGYESVYSFSRAFKKETGMSPTTWKRRHQTVLV